MTAGPSAGPASTYPTFRRPASICFSGPNDVFVPGLFVGRSADCASLDMGWWPSEQSAPGVSSAAPADSPAIAKRRRDIPIGSVSFTANLPFEFHCWLSDLAIARFARRAQPSRNEEL